jgi:uncharacterized protein
LTFPATVITGASGGIGEALVYEFARERPALVLVARSIEALGRVAQQARERRATRVETMALDLERRDAADQLEAALISLGLHVETLVNNAGFGASGAFAGLDEAVETGMVDLNVRALTALCRRFLPGMIERRRGGILNIASTASFLPGPGMAVYYASKAYVLSLSEALAHEVGNTGVTVTALCPGPTVSGFSARAGLEGSTLFRVMPTMSAARVAAIGYRGFRAGRPVVITGWRNRIMVASLRFAPRRIVLGMTSAMHRRRAAGD